MSDTDNKTGNQTCTFFLFMNLLSGKKWCEFHENKAYCRVAFLPIFIFYRKGPKNVIAV